MCPHDPICSRDLLPPSKFSSNTKAENGICNRGITGAVSYVHLVQMWEQEPEWRDTGAAPLSSSGVRSDTWSWGQGALGQPIHARAHVSKHVWLRYLHVKCKFSFSKNRLMEQVTIVSRTKRRNSHWVNPCFVILSFLNKFLCEMKASQLPRTVPLARETGRTCVRAPVSRPSGPLGWGLKWPEIREAAFQPWGTPCPGTLTERVAKQLKVPGNWKE